MTHIRGSIVISISARLAEGPGFNSRLRSLLSSPFNLAKPLFAKPRWLTCGCLLTRSSLPTSVNKQAELKQVTTDPFLFFK